MPSSDSPAGIPSTPGAALKPSDITIAVTVYSRRAFVMGAIRSALAQSVPVKVIVVEDCGPDAGMRDFICGNFGNRIEYFRNPVNRGLFDNWNACLDYCQTPWLSILHDDDELLPNFIESMIGLAGTAPGRALYCGQSGFLDENGGRRPPDPPAWQGSWRDLDLPELADACVFWFPGQLLRVAAARKIGGFHPRSLFTGDWDMWFRLALEHGAAQTAAEVSLSRSHYGADRGTSRVERKGWKWALDNVQRKKNLALLKRQNGLVIPFDRAKFLGTSPIPTRTLIREARNFSRRALRYNTWLFLHSKPPNLQYALLQSFVRVFGPGAFRIASRLFGGKPS